MLKKNLHWLLYGLFVLGCAKQSAPTGGPKDTIPPKLVSSDPRQEQTNFKGKTLDLLFTEMVIANNPKEQLIITPSVGKDFDVKARKNSIIVTLKNEPDSNTTYTFNFRDAVQDITEKNPVKNLKLAFSTGSYLDSLSISGSVQDLLTAKGSKDATVALHVKNDTFSIFKHPATIFTRTNDKGIFLIDHLKPGIYYLYAFDDKNKNLYIDSKTESYGFIADSIFLQKDTSKLSLNLVRLDARPLKLTGSRPFNSYFNIRFSKNLEDFTLTAIDSSDTYSSFGEDQSTIKVYNTIAPGDSIQLRLSATDSIKNKLDTTLYAKFVDREVTPEKFDVSLKKYSLIGSQAKLEATLVFTKPIKEINFDSLYFQYDSTTISHVSKEDLTWKESTKTLTIKKQLDKKFFPDEQQPGFESAPVKKLQSPSKEALNKKDIITNQLYSGKGAFISIEKDSSKKITQNITPLKASDLSQIEYDIKVKTKNIIVQLTDKNLQVLKEIYNTPKGKFENLPAGEYVVRVVIDKNNNRKWDPGNYFNKDEPEPVLYCKDPKGSQSINLKANWELVLGTLLTTY